MRILDYNTKGYTQILDCMHKCRLEKGLKIYALDAIISASRNFTAFCQDRAKIAVEGTRSYLAKQVSYVKTDYNTKGYSQTLDSMRKCHLENGLKVYALKVIISARRNFHRILPKCHLEKRIENLCTQRDKTRLAAISPHFVKTGQKLPLKVPD